MFAPSVAWTYLDTPHKRQPSNMPAGFTDALLLQHSENSNDWFPRIRAFRQDSKDIERASWPGNSPPVAGGASNQVKAGMQQAAAMTAGEATEPHSKRASFNVQAGALWRKNVAYQRRNIGTNVCLLCAPILFCLVLLVLQSAIGRLLKGEQSEVGCLLLLSKLQQQLYQQHHQLDGAENCSVQGADETCLAQVHYALGFGIMHTAVLVPQFGPTKCIPRLKPAIRHSTAQLHKCSYQQLLKICRVSAPVCSVAASVRAAASMEIPATARPSLKAPAPTSACSTTRATVVLPFRRQLSTHSVILITHPPGPQSCRLESAAPANPASMWCCVCTYVHCQQVFKLQCPCA